MDFLWKITLFPFNYYFIHRYKITIKNLNTCTWILTWIVQWKVGRYDFDARKWQSKENTLLHVEGYVIDAWIPLVPLMILFQSAVDYGRDCPKDLWLWHSLWYSDAHDKQQGECSMDGSWGLWRCACKKHYICLFFLGGGVHDANFAKLKVNLYCTLIAHKFFVIWKWCQK